MKYTDVPKLVDDFLEYMQVIKNRSENTIKEYHYDLKNMCIFLKLYKTNNNIDKIVWDSNLYILDLDIDFFKSIETTDFYNYLTYLDKNYNKSTHKNLKSTSRARKVSSIKSYYNFLANNLKLLDKNPVIGLDRPKLEKRLPKYLTLEESKSLLQSVKFNEQKFGKRDYCILTLFLNCGLRLSELVNINLKDIKNDRLTVIGKGDKERSIHLNFACLNAISKYMEVRPKDSLKDRDALFISERGTRIGRRMVELIVKKYVELSGLDSNKYTPHKLRHTAATLMHKYGHVDIRALQQVLGHESISTTQIYTHVDSDEVKNAIDNNPLNNII